MKNLKIYTITERKPNNNDTIYLFGTTGIGGEISDFRFVEVEYTVVKFEGEDIGDQLYYEDGMEIPKDCRLVLIDKNTGYELMDDDQYSEFDDVKALFG